MNKMLNFLIVASAPLSLAAAAPADSPLTPVKAFLDGFNRGEVASVSAAQRGTTMAIMDEVPPHIWLGGRAVDAWMTSLNAYDQAHGRTDGAVAMSAPQVTTMDGSSAYVVAPAVYSFKQKGRLMRETATMTFALHHAASGWKIVGWSWNGTVPKLAAK